MKYFQTPLKPILIDSTKEMTLDYIKVDNSNANTVEGLWDTASFHANVEPISTSQERFPG